MRKNKNDEGKRYFFAKCEANASYKKKLKEEKKKKEVR